MIGHSRFAISDTVSSCQCNHVHDGFCGTFRRCLTWFVPLHLPLFCSMTIMTMHCFACRGTYCLACSFVGHMFLHCSKSVQNVHLHIKLKHRSREDPVLTCKKYKNAYKQMNLMCACEIVTLSNSRRSLTCHLLRERILGKYRVIHVTFSAS